MVNMILIFISFHAAGQQAQDTLYLKDGSKVAGKLVGKSLKEYRLQSNEGMIFIFTRDYVEKIIHAERINLGALTADEFIYYNKAIKMRNTGMALTLGGIGVAAGGVIAATALTMSTGGDEYSAIIFGGIFVIAGAIPTLIGIPLWAVGGSRKAITEFNLQLHQINSAPQGSMILGLGLTINF